MPIDFPLFNTRSFDSTRHATPRSLANTNTRPDPTRWIAMGVLLSALAACGGESASSGDAEASGSTAANSASSGASNSAAAGNAAATGADASVTPLDSANVDTASLNAFARSAVQSVNAIRQTARVCDASQPTQISPAVGAVSWNTRLEASAFGHAKDMQASNFVDHIGSNGSTIGQRVTAQGYVWSVVGENLGAGFASLDSILQYWLSSPSHCKVLMTGDFVEIGMVVIAGTSGNSYQNFWALDLARAR